MRVVVTGSAGKIGRAAMVALRQAGHRATGLDLRATPDRRNIAVDCTDFGAVMGALSGIDSIGGVPDAVIHLAGIPAPGLATDQHIFSVNIESTYNIFSACARLGIKRIAWASSETILGLPFAIPPAFAPLDETHPDRPSWSYALAKQLGETMADSFVAWNPGMSIASLRFSNVYTPDDYAAIGEIQAKPEARRFNLWGYIDAEDAGEACRLAVEAPFIGHEKMIIAAADTIMARSSAELLRDSFPDVPLKGTVEGNMSLLSSAHAKAVIGFQPRRSWRDRG